MFSSKRTTATPPKNESQKFEFLFHNVPVKPLIQCLALSLVVPLRVPSSFRVMVVSMDCFEDTFSGPWWPVRMTAPNEAKIVMLKVTK